MAEDTDARIARLERELAELKGNGAPATVNYKQPLTGNESREELSKRAAAAEAAGDTKWNIAIKTHAAQMLRRAQEAADYAEATRTFGSGRAPSANDLDDYDDDPSEAMRSLDAQIAEAYDRGDVKAAVALKAQRAAEMSSGR